MRYPKLPLLPGNSVNLNVGQTRFHKSHHLDFVVKGVPYITEKKLPGIGGAPLLGTEEEDKKPSIYALGEVVKVPPWLVFDKHVLTFYAYYIENTKECAAYDYIVHHCKIYFFLEDGTIKVVEQKHPFQDGLASGCIINRQKIRYPNNNAKDFYDILDFNICNKVEFFGKVFYLNDCDGFTRTFLNRLGIHVPEKIQPPEDPYTKLMIQKNAKPIVQPRLNKKMTLDEFLSDDNRRLTFNAYWDDRNSDNGFVHLLLVYYYLVDETIEIKDVTDKQNVINILKRGLLPMDVKYVHEGPGTTEPHTVLNAIGQNVQSLRYILDPLDLGKDSRAHYTDKDMRIGSVLTAFGRKIVIYDCDQFTKAYYKTKYGLENQESIDRPKTKEEELEKREKTVKFTVPPYNGFGTYEDSLANCLKFHYDAIVRPYKQFLEKDKTGYDSKILRFVARMMIKNQPTQRVFVMSYFLVDDTIAVYEIEQPNSGARGGMFISKKKIFKPGEKLVTTRQPEFFTIKDLYIGNTVCFDEFYFYIFASDEYTLRYMELHPNEYPKSNINLITSKVKEAVKPTFKEFVSKFLNENDIPPAAYAKFRDEIFNVMGGKVSEHEILTLARHYSFAAPKEIISFETLKMYTHDELRKRFYDDFQRLKECFLHYDEKKSGYVSKGDAYKIMRGCKVPLDIEHIRILLEKFGRGENCDIVYDEFINFLNYNCHPYSKHIVPVNIPSIMSWLQTCREGKVTVAQVDVDKFIKDFDLEKELENQCK